MLSIPAQDYDRSYSIYCPINVRSQIPGTSCMHFSHVNLSCYLLNSFRPGEHPVPKMEHTLHKQIVL